MRTVQSAVVIVVLIAASALADERAQKLADQVMQEAGIEAWNDVTRIRFTFNVESDGKTVMSASHDWDRIAGTDTVTWNDKTVTVDLGDPGEGDDAKTAFGRWTNDAYWLLAPLKLADGGVKLAHQGTRQKGGREYEILHLSFEGVGLTPGDQYSLFVNPQTYRIEHWEYSPNPDRTVPFTWEGYETFDGLTLSTEHRSGNRRIFFTDIVVTR